MGKIVLLDELTINQIAAGEVIERPASVVKELVENSIDAGAKSITIEIKNGGISLIRISDDGCGIAPDDMEMSLERHATSKIRKATDLDNIKTMGFRGEALASIAAISKMHIISRTDDEDTAYEIKAEGGDIVDKGEASRKKGTTITVEELFYNTPVRYKFLKKDFTETGYIEEMVERIALANPKVKIKLLEGDKETIQTLGSGNLNDTIYSIYGKETAENLIPVEYKYEDIKVTGVIGKPILSRSNRTNQLFYVNNRFVKDKTLSSAAEQGFKGFVTVGKHGFLILNVDISPKKVDVNVHPTKLEIRFQEEQVVFKAVYHAIKETLLKADLIVNTEKDYTDGEKVSEEDADFSFKNLSKSNGLTNKSRVNAWSINKDTEEKEPEKTEETDSEDEEVTEAMPKYNEFKSTITSFDKETREKFINDIQNAKTSDDILKSLHSFKEMSAKKMAEETKEEVEEDVKEVKDIKEETEKAEEPEKEEKVEETTEAKEEEPKEAVEEKEETIESKIEKVSDETKIMGAIFEKKPTKFKASNQETKIINILKEISSNKGEFLSSDKKAKPIKDEEEETDSIKEKIDSTSEELKNSHSKDKAAADTKEDILKKLAETNKSEKPETDKKDEKSEMSESTFEEMYKKLFGRDISQAQKEYKEENEKASLGSMEPLSNGEVTIFENEISNQKKPYNFVGIAFRTYIILTINDELYIMDQHAAHERIMYEKVKANYYNDENKDSQLMLLPDVITLNNKEMGIFKDNKELFNKAGFMVEEFGENTIKLSGVPEFCLNFNTQELFLETLDEVDTVNRTAKQEIEDKFLATIACKAAVKAHMALNKEEVDSLMQELLALPNPFSCPHGRPTVIKMTKSDIEKKFSRRL